MLDQIKAVIFDLDGTLVDSMWIWTSIDVEYLDRFHIELPDDLQYDIEGKSFTETAHYFKERFQIEDSVEEIKATWNDMAFEKYKNHVQLKEGVKEFLERCRALGIKLGIATSNSTHLAETVLKRHGILSMFDTITTGCDVNVGKPEPDVYLEAAKRLQVEPEHCLVFEDLAAGITAGKRAGMTVCAVADPYSKYQWEEKKALADYHIGTYDEVVV